MADKTTVDLLPISDEDFKAFLDLQISEYAREKIKSGNWVESEAYDLSRKSFMGLLPDGKDTSGHSILTITDAESKTGVGTLWVEWKNKEHNFANWAFTRGVQFYGCAFPVPLCTC